jgi:hypothetical protein
MENDNIQDIIKTQYQKLPPEVQKAITATDLPTKLEQISKKYNLRIDQAGSLQVETMLIMLGLESSDDFVDNVSKNLEVSGTTAQLITADINSDILGNIRSSLMQMQAEEEIKDEIASVEIEKDSQNNFSKEHVLNTIENPTSFTATNPPINLLSEEYPLVIPGQKSEPTQKTVSTVIPSPTIPSTPVKPAPSLNMMERMMSAPVSTKTETVEKKIGPDPYREPIG